MILYRGFNVLTALGYQEELPFRSDELAMSILGNYCKIVIEAYIFGLIFHYLVKPNPEVQANQKRLAAAEQYCDERNLSQELKQKVTKYVKFQQSHASAVAEQVLSAIPTSLKARLALERCTSVVQRNMHVFGGCSSQFLSRFMMALHEVHLMPSEVVLKAGDIARELSFVEVGSLQILDNTDQVVEILAGEGTTPCVVGATSFFMGVPEQYHVRSRDDEECALLAINKADANDVIATLPEEHDVITTNILAQYGLSKDGEDTGGAASGGDDDAFAAIQEAIKAALKQTQDRALEQLISSVVVGDVDTVDTLLAQGCPMNAGDYDQRTPLHLAVAKGQKSVVQLLLERGAKHSPVDRWGADPLRDAIALGHFDIAELLIAKGARLTSEQYAIMADAASTNISNLQCIVLRAGADVNVGDCDLRTLLHTASALGDFTMVQNLIAVGTTAHSKDRWGGTPIEDAITNNEPLITAFLAKHGARASAKYQQEALFHAAQVGSVRLVDILAASGASLGSQNYDKISAIHVAAAENNVAALAEMTSEFEDVNITDLWGRTPLDYAVASKCWPCVVLLIAQAGKMTDSGGREAVSAASATKLLPDLHSLRRSLKQVKKSPQPDAAALGALYGVQHVDGVAAAMAQQRKLLSSNLQALEALRVASGQISATFQDVLAIAHVLSQVLNVAAPKTLNKNLTRTASLKATPRKDLTKALMPVLMRSTAVQEACQHLSDLVQAATSSRADKDTQLRTLLTDAGMRMEHLSIEAGVPLCKEFSACFTGPAGMEQLDVFAILSCPVFRRNVEETRVFGMLSDKKYPLHEVPLVIKLACCLKWSDELWAAITPPTSADGTGHFDFARVAPQIWQVLKNQRLDHLWATLSKLLEERHDSLDRCSFTYVFFSWLSMFDQAGSDDGRLGEVGADSSSRDGSDLGFDWDRDRILESGDYQSQQELVEVGAEELEQIYEETQNGEAVVRWVSLLAQAESQDNKVAVVPERDDTETPAKQAVGASSEEDRGWLEELIATKDARSALQTLLQLTLRERFAALLGFEISNREKGQRIFDQVNRSGSGTLPSSVLDLLASCFSQELRFNRQAMDVVETYVNTSNPLNKEDFEHVFSLLAAPGDDAKLPVDAPSYVFHPNSQVLRYWNRLTMALAIYLFWEVPVSVAFRPAVTFGEDFVYATRALEVIFALEVLSNFARAFYSDNGSLIYRSNHIQRIYTSHRWFVVDLLTFTPFNLLLLLAKVSSEHPAYAWLRLPRLVAVARTLLYRRDGKNLFSQGSKNNRGEGSARAMFHRIMVLLLGVTCLTHLMACCWWYIGTYGQPHNIDEYEDRYGEIDEDNRPPHWVFFHRGLGTNVIWDESTNVLKQYYFSFYWTASTLSTSGLVGETTPKNLVEIAFTIVCMLATITVWAYIMGEISNLVLSNSERLVTIREKVQLVQTFLQNRSLTRGLANDIISVFYEKLYTNDDTAQVFSSLSSSLMYEVAMHLSLPLVKSLDVFSACSASFVASLSVLLREKQLASDETLFALGDAPISLYVVASSSITLTVPGIGDQDVECGRLGPGAMVGDTAFFFRLRHINTATVGAKAATLFVLSRPDYDQLCASYVLDSELVMKKMIDAVNGGGKAGASQVSTSDDMPEHVRRKLQGAVKRQTESATLTLIEAASKGDLQTLRAMVDAGRVHIDDSSNDARTALHLAASNNHLELVQVMLTEWGASVAPRDATMGTPLDDAVRHRRFEVVRYLASAHNQRIEATPAYVDKWIQAAADDDLELMRIMLMAGMPVNVVNANGRAALHIAVCSRSFSVVKHLLTLDDLELGAIDRMGSTAMWDALVACDAEMCKLLAEKGAPVQDDIANYMCKAASEDNATFIDLACDHNVNILCRDLFGRTPLHVAASSGALRCVDAMAHKLESKVNTVDVFGSTALDNAVQAGDPVVTAILQQAGGLRGNDASLSSARADVRAWSEATRQARRAEHQRSVAARLPEATAGRECIAVAQALTAFVQAMYSNTNIYTAALHEAARQQIEMKSTQRTSGTGELSAATGVESRAKGALSAIVASLTELRDVLAAPPKPYNVLEYGLLRKVGDQAVPLPTQIHHVKEKLNKVIDVAGKVLATLEHQGLRLQTFAVQRLVNMLSRGIWTHLNVDVPSCVMELTDDELSYVQRWERGSVQRYLLQKTEKEAVKRQEPEGQSPAQQLFTSKSRATARKQSLYVAQPSTADD